VPATPTVRQAATTVQAPQPGEDQTEQLLERWEAEDATDDLEEIAAAERDPAAFKANMNANRALSGERPVYNDPVTSTRRVRARGPPQSCRPRPGCS
jgi:hypothetical protein